MINNVGKAEENKVVKPVIEDSGLSNDMVLQVLSFLPGVNDLRKCELVCRFVFLSFNYYNHVSMC